MTPRRAALVAAADQDVEAAHAAMVATLGDLWVADHMRAAASVDGAGIAHEKAHDRLQAAADAPRRVVLAFERPGRVSIAVASRAGRWCVHRAVVRVSKRGRPVLCDGYAVTMDGGRRAHEGPLTWATALDLADDLAAADRAHGQEPWSAAHHRAVWWSRRASVPADYPPPPRRPMPRPSW